MPWKVSGVVEQRLQFLREYATGEWTMTELCRAYEISRPTGYALWQRSSREGAAGVGGRRGGAGAAAGAHALGRAQTESVSGVEAAGGELAGGKYDRRDAATRGSGGRAQDTAQGAAVHATVRRRAGAESALVRGFQRLVSHRGRRTDRSADRDGCMQPVFAALPGGGEDGHGAGASDFRSGVSRVRNAGGDSHRQRCAVCVAGGGGVVATGGVVDETRDRAGAHRCGTSRAERAARAYAPDDERGNGHAPASHPAGAAAHDG